jgi:pimeloyl-ACP methyl ester carboxylesterase
MNAFLRWIVIIVFTMTLAFAVLAQTNQAFPGGVTQFAGGTITNVQRTVLHGDIVHYRFDVKVGPGPFDVIWLHRVVRERHPYEPVQTLDGVLLLPGSPNYFEAIFMAPLHSQVPAWDRSIVIFLAQHDIDVWGVDYAWALVPAETTDFSFMKGWGVAKDSQHTEIALSLARMIRGFTGQGFGQLNLLGFSYGGMIGYNLVGQESQQPRVLRNVKGLISLDFGMKFKEQAYRDLYCRFADADQANLDAGVYNDDSGLFLEFLSQLAVSDPNGPSDIIPGTTNYQAALTFGANTALVNGQFWHFVGGYLDKNGVANALRFTEPGLWLDLLQVIPPHLPTQSDLDIDATFCGKSDVPFDDHLRQITLPILLAGAAGGFGRTTIYTTTLTGSKDVTILIAQRLPDSQRDQDFGHADTTLGKDARTLVWKPVLDWIVAHR